MNETILRLESSIPFLEDGQTFKVGDFVLGRAQGGRILVNGYLLPITGFDPRKASREWLKNQLFQVKEEFYSLIAKSDTFVEFEKEKGSDFYLVMDSGASAYNLCAEINGSVEFFLKLEEPDD